jgi:hypothetical protein
MITEERGPGRHWLECAFLRTGEDTCTGGGTKTPLGGWLPQYVHIRYLQGETEGGKKKEKDVVCV